MSEYESIVGINFWTMLFTLVNMIITFLILKSLLFKPVKKMIDNRQKEIDSMYEDAENSRAEAKKILDNCEDEIQRTKVFRDELLQTAVATFQRREQEIIDSAHAEADAMRAKARADIEQERRRVANEMKDDISELAIQIASKVAEKEIDEKNHEALIDDFIRHMGDAS